MSEALLAINELRVQYGHFVAVDGLSLQLHGGDLLGMIGPNGAGKTEPQAEARDILPLFDVC